MNKKLKRIYLLFHKNFSTFSAFPFCFRLQEAQIDENKEEESYFVTEVENGNDKSFFVPRKYIFFWYDAMLLLLFALPKVSKFKELMNYVV